MLPLNDHAPHVSVLYNEIILALRPESPGRYIDATVGAGGHAWGILKASAPNGQLLGFDLDPQALEIANQRLDVYAGRYILRQASYTTLLEAMRHIGWESVHGILLDLGVSSMEFDTPLRGFSLMHDGPLDMRFSPQATLTAADIVNAYDEADLADLLWRYGEEQQSRRIARAILQARPITRTLQLADVILRAFQGKRGRIHPATKTFQARRIAVNGELTSLEAVLPQAVQALQPGGRLAVISFHSLEDRLVKQYFKRESQDCICPVEQPVCTCGHHASIELITRHPILPGEAEAQANPRARSAKLRVAQKLTGTRVAR